jgi:hypothetical protein
MYHYTGKSGNVYMVQYPPLQTTDIELAPMWSSMYGLHNITEAAMKSSYRVISSQHAVGQNKSQSTLCPTIAGSTFSQTTWRRTWLKDVILYGATKYWYDDIKKETHFLTMSFCYILRWSLPTAAFHNVMYLAMTVDL